MTPLLRLGAFDVALDDCAAHHRELLEGIFRVQAEPMPADGAAALRLVLGASHRGSSEHCGRAVEPFGVDDTLSCVDENCHVMFTTDVLVGRLDFESPCRLALRIDAANPRARHLDHYLRIVMNAVLRRFDRMRFHAAAVEYGGAVALFVGDKGAGKTTISVHLARAGGTMLGEDQIMMRKTTEGAFLAAGGDDRMRLTAKTEERYFPGLAQAPAVETGGVWKKEIRAQGHVACLPNVERPVQRLFFPRVGEAFAIQPIGRRDALGRLSAPLLPIHRFTNDRDRLGFLTFLAGLTAQADCYALTLTPDLSDLEKLTRFLS